MRRREQSQACAEHKAAFLFQHRLAGGPGVRLAEVALRPKVLLSAALLVVVASPLVALVAASWGGMLLLRTAFKPMLYVLGIGVLLAIGAAGGYSYSVYQTAIPHADQVGLPGGPLSPGPRLTGPAHSTGPSDGAVPSDPSDPYDLLRGR